MPCFVVNTKLGTAMIDSLGGPSRVNNFLTALNIKPISDPNLKKMEVRAGEVVELVAKESAQVAAKLAYKAEMRDIAKEETSLAESSMTDLIEDLGVCPMPDASPSFKLSFQSLGKKMECDDGDKSSETVQNETGHVNSSRSPLTYKPLVKEKMRPDASCCKKSRVSLSTKFPCRTRSGTSCAVDTAWHKRGFDSLTSHTFFMSKSIYGKKVVKTVVGHRTCGVCNWWRRRRPGQPVRDHQCVRNHSSSARMMESTSGVQGVKELAQDGTPVEYLEGDGDNTLIARLKSDLNIDMKKRFDRNHIVKNIGKSLYDLRNEKGIKLSKTVICHIEKCLKYAFATNQGDPDGLRDNLRALIPHQFGNHSLCKSQFCNFKRKPHEHYIHRSLPYKVPLKDEALRTRLQGIFEPLITCAHQYADLGSSQQCEHGNKEVCLRAPKSHHYGNTKSLDYRVHASAAFINEGRQYITQGYSRFGLSPGHNLVKYANTCMKHRLYGQQKSILPVTKRRRLQLKQERCINQGALETLEGVSYQPGIGHEAAPDVTKLPDAVSHGKFKPVVPQSGEPTIITFDLETTDLIRHGIMPHITQIAAVNVQSGSSISIYIKPELPISSEAQKVTGIIMCGDKMTVHGNEVANVLVKKGIEQLCIWLTKFSNVLLIAHNGRRFDFPVLVKTLMNTNLFERFNDCVLGFVDSLPIFRKLYPKLSHKQVDLVHTLLGCTYDAHNAEADVTSLGQLLTYTTLPTSEFLTYSYSPLAIQNSIMFNHQKSLNLSSLDPLLSGGVCKRPTAENIAGSGLNLSHLLLIYKRSGEDGLRDVFTAKNSDDLPRVTNSKKVLEEMLPKLCRFFETKEQQ